MNRAEYLEFCKVCENRKLDSQQGIICSLTGKIAAFEGECKDFKMEESLRQVEEIRQEKRKADKAAGRTDLAAGAFWLLAGILATALDIGYIFWGAIAYGLFRLIKGAIRQ
jgi:hypothetical protein